MRPLFPIQALLHSTADAPFYLEERVCIGRDNRGRDFIKHRNFYIRDRDGNTMCLGTNESRMRDVLRALMSPRPIVWVVVDSPANHLRR